MKNTAIFGAVVLVLSSSLAAAAPAPGDTLEQATDASKRALMKKGMDAAKSRLTKPATVRFQHVYFSASRNNNPAVACGEYRHQKADGSDSGAQRFISYGTADDTFLEEEVAPFAEAWDGLCK